MPYSESGIIADRCSLTRLFLRQGCDLDETLRYLLLDCKGKKGLDLGYRVPAQSSPTSQSHKGYVQQLLRSARWTAFLRDQHVDLHTVFDGPQVLFNAFLVQLFVSDAYPKTMTGMITLMCALGADVSIRDVETGEQPLHILARLRHAPEKEFDIMAQLVMLLLHGADPLTRDYNGVSPFLRAFMTEGGAWKLWIKTFADYGLYGPESIRRHMEESEYYTNVAATGADIGEPERYPTAGLTRRSCQRGDRLDDV